MKISEKMRGKLYFISMIPLFVFHVDTKSRRMNRKPQYIEDIMDLASELSTSTTFEYKYGLAYQLNKYTADGTVFDYMAGVKRVRFFSTSLVN